VWAEKGHSELNRLLVLTQRHHQHQAEYAILCQQQEWLRQIDQILTPSQEGWGIERAWEASWELWGLLRQLERVAHIQPCHHAFVHAVIKWTRNLGMGLYQCFRDARLPRTNNDLERFFRQRKGDHRRMTGHRSWNRYIVRFGRYVAFHDPADPPQQVFRRMQHITATTYRTERDCWRSSLLPYRQHHRFRRNPHDYLLALESAWFPDG
jgi:hypothetical protein